LRLLDSRRLTGPNLLSREPVALAEVGLEPGEDRERAAALWAQETARLCAAVELPLPRTFIRTSARGASLAFAAEIDVLMAATDINDWSVPSAAELLAGRPALEMESAIPPLREKLGLARRPRLLALQREARARGLPFLWDDELVSVGHGARSRSWPIGEPPEISQIPWHELGRVPVALITGTNGKTTSARLLARIAQLAGKTVGLASTDALAVAGRVLEQGDFTGPMAARTVLRHPEVDFAVLETARGGILRRGLAVEEADAALMTNVDDDHLGEYGIDTVDDLARAKAVVGSVVVPSGRVILNADDSRLLKLAGSFVAPTALFSLDASSAAVRDQVARGGEAWALRGEELVQLNPAGIEPILAAAEVALSFGGAARFNLANALGVAALASALGLPRAALLEGLRKFGPNAADNPGRANLALVGGVSVLIDFGHNPHGVRAIAPLAAELRRARGGGRLFIISGGAGDRSDDNLRSLARELFAQQPYRVLLRDLDDYLRGRAPGEVPALIAAELIRLGLSAEAVAVAPSEVAALRTALDEARPGDFVLLLVHLDAEGVRATLAERMAQLNK
jgi:cyanophycin synthetase